jgi:hypothetical protein
MDAATGPDDPRRERDEQPAEDGYPADGDGDLESEDAAEEAEETPGMGS